MKKLALVATAATTGAALTLAGCSQDGSGSGSSGDAYPSGPVKIVAPADPGSGWDMTARAIAADMAKEKIITTPLPVENRPGAVGTVFLAEMVQKHKGKDDTVAMTSLAMNVNTALKKTQYSYKDVTMIAGISAEHFVIVAGKDSKYKDLNSALSDIKADPGKVPVGAATDDQFPFSLIVDQSGGDAKAINYVTYEGGGEQSTALLAGDIQLAIGGVSEFLPLIESGDVKPLAVVADKKVEGVDAPATKELGIDVTIANWRGLYGPPDMPEASVKFWQDALKKLSESESWKQTAAKNQWTTQYMAGDEFKAYLEKTQKQVDEGMALVSGQ